MSVYICSSRCIAPLRYRLPALSHPLYTRLSSAPRHPYTTKAPLPTNYQSNRPTASTPSIALNPPPSTLPPSLELPDRAPDQSAFSYYFNLGRRFLTFYKTGLSAVYTNWKVAKALKSRLPPSITPYEAVRQNLLSRAEYQLLQRSKRDVSRIPAFVLVYLVCGEFTPLVVGFMSGVIPGTCWIPKQVDGNRVKAEERRKLAFRAGIVAPSQEGKSRDELSPQDSVELTLYMGQVLNAYPRLWDRVGFRPLPLVRRRVNRRIDEIDLDDFAIARDGGVAPLEAEEVRLAAETRGLDVLRKEDGELKKVLGNWLVARKRHPIEFLLLHRPSEWGRDGRM